MQLSLLSIHDSRCEPRYKVLMRGRMRAGGLPTEVCVRDVSSRGLLLQSAAPPVSGTIVEILVAKRSIVGRVRWSKDRRFGIELNPPISVDALLASAVGASSKGDAPGCAASVHKIKPPPGGARKSEATRQQSAQMQFAAVVMLTLVAAIWMSSLIHEAASQSSRTVAAALRGKG